MLTGETQYTPRTIAYLRISTGEQDIIGQKLELHEYARRNDIKINEFIEIEISFRKSTQARKIDELLENLHAGDLLLVGELSRLGRSVAQSIQIVDTLIKKKFGLLLLRNPSELTESWIFKPKRWLPCLVCLRRLNGI